MGGPENSHPLKLADLVAIVIGGAVAALHVRRANPAPVGRLEWSLSALLFGWLTLTATGPFLYLARRWRDGTSPTFPRTGDRLWLLWGCPWILSALLGSGSRLSRISPGQLDMVYVGSLGLGLFLTTMVALPVLAARCLWGGPLWGRRGIGPYWSQWVGLGLTAAWPLQCGVGLVLMG